MRHLLIHAKSFARVEDAEGLRLLWSEHPHAVLANLAHLCYHELADVRSCLERLGVERVDLYEVKQARAVVLRFDGRVLV